MALLSPGCLTLCIVSKALPPWQGCTPNSYLSAAVLGFGPSRLVCFSPGPVRLRVHPFCWSLFPQFLLILTGKACFLTLFCSDITSGGFLNALIIIPAPALLTSSLLVPFALSTFKCAWTLWRQGTGLFVLFLVWHLDYLVQNRPSVLIQWVETQNTSLSFMAIIKFWSN